MTIQIIGSYISPYVRKVLVILDLKQIPYEIDPIVPFYGDNAFSRLSPLRRIPVLIDRTKDIVLNDSTVIAEFLEDAYPNMPIYPKDPIKRARARWFEEYADSHIGDVFIWQLFNQNIRKYVWNLPVDEEVVERALNEYVPRILGYLESQAPERNYLLGELSIADIALGSFFRNFQFAGYSVDGVKWPKVKTWVNRIHALEPFVKLSVYEKCSLTVPVPQIRDALCGTDAPLTTETHGTNEPISGPMTRF